MWECQSPALFWRKSTAFRSSTSCTLVRAAWAGDDDIRNENKVSAPPASEAMRARRAKERATDRAGTTVRLVMVGPLSRSGGRCRIELTGERAVARSQDRKGRTGPTGRKVAQPKCDIASTGRRRA